MKTVIPFMLIVFILAGCTKRRARKDDEKIKDYISENNLDATKTDSGLYYVIDVEGTGDNPTSASTVTVAYTGYFLDGDIFDESQAGITFSLSNVIEGWKEGIPYFKEGGSGMLLIPSALAYGRDGTNGIPGNSVLLFDIGLIEVQ